MVDPFGYFLSQAVLHNWCNKDHGICILSGIVYIKEPLQLIRKSASLNKTFLSFLDVSDRVTSLMVHISVAAQPFHC